MFPHSCTKLTNYETIKFYNPRTIWSVFEEWSRLCIHKPTPLTIAHCKCQLHPSPSLSSYPTPTQLPDHQPTSMRTLIPKTKRIIRGPKAKPGDRKDASFW